MKKLPGYVMGFAILILIMFVLVDRNFAQSPEFEPIWSVTTNDVTWFGTNTERAIAYHDGKVYVASRGDGAFVRILDAGNGAYLGELDASGLTGGDVTFNGLSVSDDGRIFASNLAVNAQSNPFKLYTWDDEDNVQNVITWNAPGAYRMADNITVVGSVSDGTAVIYAAVGTSPIVYRWVMESDGLGGFQFINEPQEFVLPNTTAWGTPAHVAPKGPGEASGFWAGGRSLGYTRSFIASNTTTGYGRFPSDGNGLGNLAIELKSFDNAEYLFFIKGTNRIYVNEVGPAGGVWTVRDGTNLAESAVLGSGGSNILGDLAVADMGDGTFRVFALVTNAGVFALEIQLVEPDDPDPVVIDQIPYFEDFSGVDLDGAAHAEIFPDGWNTIGEVQVSAWGEISAQDLRFPSPTANPMAITPEIDEEIDISGLNVSFEAHYATNGDAGDQIDVGFMSDPGNAATFTIAGTVTLQREVTLFTVYLATYDPENGRHIAFRARRGGSWNSHYLGNIRIYSADDLLVTGSSGWRMLSSPVSGSTVADIAGQNQVQGFDGLAAFYGAEAPSDIENASPNLYLAYNGTSWSAAGALTDELESGKGFLWYMYDNDIGVSVSLPFLLSPEGSEPVVDVSVNLHSVGNKFNLLGNPYQSSLDLSGLAGWTGANGLGSYIVQVWENSQDGWQQGTGHSGEWKQLGPGGVDGDILAAWQGFMVENDNAAQLVIPESARTSGGTFYKESPPQIKRLTFVLDGDNQAAGIRTRDRAHVVFSDQAAHDWDMLDASQLTPLAGSFATLSFVGDRNGETILKSQESRPLELEKTLELPASLNVHNMGGDMAISWIGLDELPSDWQITLVDHETGTATDLRSASSYEFRMDAPIEKRAMDAGDAKPDITPLVAGDQTQPRFTVVVMSEPLSTETPADLPKELTLDQNYPNPFNPSTVISYAMPEQAHVRLAIYDLTGRRISTLVDEQQGPGRHNVTWDASQLASGVYIYRLEAAGQKQTRRMTLIK